MIILYYDLLRGRNTSTASNHVNEIIRNLEKLGNTILLRDNNVQKEEGLEKPPNSSLNLWGKIGTRWPIMGIFLSLVGEIRVFIRGIIALNKIKSKPDIVYYRHGLFNAGLWTAKLLRVPAVKEINGIVANERDVANQAKGIVLNIIDHIEKRNMPYADKIIVVTSKLKQLLINEYNVPEEKIKILENGANIDVFKPMDKGNAISKLRLNTRYQYVCFVGNFAAWQGLEYLIKSVPHVLKECPDARFLLVGDGDLKERLESMVKDIGVSDKVLFTGMVPYQDVPYYINVSDVCVAPKLPLKSGYSPLKLCEYLACEKPVVASRISGLEILEEHQIGLLVPPENEVALAQAIVRMLKSFSLREERGKNGRQYVVEHRSWESVARKTLEVFEELIEQD